MDCIMQVMFSVDAGAVSDPRNSVILQNTKDLPFPFAFVLAKCIPFVMTFFNIGIVKK